MPENQRIDWRGHKRYREGFMDFKAAYEIDDPIPDTPYTYDDKLAYLAGWLDARITARLARVGKKCGWI